MIYKWDSYLFLHNLNYCSRFVINFFFKNIKQSDLIFKQIHKIIINIIHLYTFVGTVSYKSSFK